ncbi:MAG: hypothetical protein Q8L68_02815 [Methylococcales bacterium]|nr:hypothetical protein [Methylococcales bacterium]
MSKNLFLSLLLALLMVLALPFAALADEANFATDIVITVGSYSLTIESGSKADSVTVGASTVSVTLTSSSWFRLKSSDRRYLTNSLANTDCGVDTSSVTFASVSPQTVVITPSATICPVATSTGGGGSSVTTTTTTMPTTSTGTVTATASGGGKTNFTTPSGIIAEATIPANTVSADTTINIASLAVSSAPAVPSGYSAIGNQFVNMTAAAGGSSVTSFSKAATIVFTYTAASINSINEDSLKIYRWNGSQWQVLASVVDKVNKKVTATTTNFSYFVLLGTPVTTTPTTTIALSEGDLFKSASASEIYVLRGGKKFHVPSWNAFTGAGYKLADVKTVEASQVSSYSDATLIKVDNDAKVYYIQNHKKRHIPTAAVFEGYGFSWGNIVSVSAKDRDGYADVNLIKVADDSKVYVIVSGMKRHVPNAEVFDDYKYNWTDIFMVSATERDAYSEATLVKTTSSSNVYYLTNNKKEWIKTAAAFNSRGFKWTDILTVSEKELSAYLNL